MAGVTAHGGAFSFNGFLGFVVGVSVETPTAEVVDMSGVSDAKHINNLVPTGAWSGGSITVDYLRHQNGPDPQSLVRGVGQLTFSAMQNGQQSFGVSRRCILESATLEARAGELVRGSLRFRMTDYQGV